MGIVRFALKSSVVGGILYYTVQEGLWSSSEDSVKFYGKIYNGVTPYLMNNVPKEVINEIPNLPSTTDISYFIKSNWNKGIMLSMNFLVDFPSHTCNIYKSMLKQPVISEMFENPNNQENKEEKKEDESGNNENTEHKPNKA